MCFMIYGCNVCACKLICCIAEENKSLIAGDKNSGLLLGKINPWMLRVRKSWWLLGTRNPEQLLRGCEDPSCLEVGVLTKICCESNAKLLEKFAWRIQRILMTSIGGYIMGILTQLGNRETPWWSLRENKNENLYSVEEQWKLWWLHWGIENENLQSVGEPWKL